MSRIKFGTDGWRAVIAEEYTFDNVRRCSQGFAAYLIEKGYQGKWVIIGYDKRFHSENFAKSAAEVLAANGFFVYLRPWKQFSHGFFCFDEIWKPNGKTGNLK